jgi:hypothetical protein
MRGLNRFGGQPALAVVSAFGVDAVGAILGAGAGAIASSLRGWGEGRSQRADTGWEMAARCPA